METVLSAAALAIELLFDDSEEQDSDSDDMVSEMMAILWARDEH